MWRKKGLTSAEWTNDNNCRPYVLLLTCAVKSEQIGPNVSVSANARIGAGVRLISCIILDDVDIKVWNLQY